MFRRNYITAFRKNVPQCTLLLLVAGRDNLCMGRDGPLSRDEENVDMKHLPLDKPYRDVV